MGKNKELTSDERELVNAYGAFESPPSVRELAEALGIPTTTAQYRLGRVREKGYLSSRPITIVRPRLTAKGRRVS